MIGDSIFAIGALVLGWFVLGLLTGHSYDKRGYVVEGEWEVRPQPAPVLHRQRGSKINPSDISRCDKSVRLGSTNMQEVNMVQYARLLHKL